MTHCQRSCPGRGAQVALRAQVVALFLTACVGVWGCSDGARRWYSGTCNNNGGSCGDGGLCIEGLCGRSCSSSADCGDGVCVKQACVPPDHVCKTDYCDDGNVCTDDYCNTANAACRHELHAGACTDNDLCTVGDECVDSSGVFACKTAPKCDDGNANTVDSCDPATGACTNKAK